MTTTSDIISATADMADVSCYGRYLWECTPGSLSCRPVRQNLNRPHIEEVRCSGKRLAVMLLSGHRQCVPSSRKGEILLRSDIGSFALLWGAVSGLRQISMLLCTAFQVADGASIRESIPPIAEYNNEVL